MLDTDFRLLNKDELTELFEHDMRRDFPDDELKPLPRLLELTDRGLYETYGLFKDGQLLAYALYWKAGDDPYVMLDYFAVMPESRNHGTGSEMLKMMLDHFCVGGRGIFGEVETPNTGIPEVDDLRRRRLGFYHRAGLREISYRTKVYGVPYIVLAYGPEIADEELLETHKRLYHTAFDNEAYARQCFIPYTGDDRQ